MNVKTPIFSKYLCHHPISIAIFYGNTNESNSSFMSQRNSLVNADLATLLADSAYQAYYPSNPVPPTNYKFVCNWKGRNPSYFGGDVEYYGVVFQGNQPNNAGEFIFSFKGTASWWDAYEDVFIHQVPFTPYQNAHPTNMVKVAEGFKDVYTAPVTNGGNDSMQHQLFQLINSLNPSKLMITGHSLGSALAELFALDLRISIPSLPFEVQHYNFACPRVGGAGFANLYNQLEAALPNQNKTIRIVNFHDVIPCVPLQDMGYQHGPDYFLIDFDKYDHWIPDYRLRHSMFNYWQVLKEVMKTPNQKFQGKVTGYQNAVLWSAIPDDSLTECSLVFVNENIEDNIRSSRMAKQ